MLFNLRYRPDLSFGRHRKIKIEKILPVILWNWSRNFQLKLAHYTKGFHHTQSVGANLNVLIGNNIPEFGVTDLIRKLGTSIYYVFFRCTFIFSKTWESIFINKHKIHCFRRYLFLPRCFITHRIFLKIAIRTWDTLPIWFWSNKKIPLS